MKTAIKKWGNSYAIRLPKSIVEEMGVGLDTELDITSKNRTIVLTAAETPRYTFEEMMASITDETMPEPFDWGPSVGKEIWE